MAAATRPIVTSSSSIIAERSLSPKERVIRWPELKDRIGFSRSHIHNLVAKGEFPPPIKLGDRASGWLESQVTAWLDQRIAQSQINSESAA
jgi:prophage regulatory protein